mmetsp:Transcript_4587/g.10010  ORF Transcript_4587/g.10010 Transcript_4587/m.10010 type:complete len:125 (+) Transcript_4587:1524-1898(+)
MSHRSPRKHPHARDNSTEVRVVRKSHLNSHLSLLGHSDHLNASIVLCFPRDFSNPQQRKVEKKHQDPKETHHLEEGLTQVSSQLIQSIPFLVSSAFNQIKLTISKLLLFIIVIGDGRDTGSSVD